MNNLLRTLTESQVQATPDLKLLLNTVRDARRQGFDNKVSEPFYESLEGLLHDVRTVTMDNHDAEAFLKPVAKSDVPDYYDVISNPMDLQTMLKKVKAKQYKSKREFKDDLDLIWSNCFTYNATEDHPLRQCAIRLKKKADRLLANITDRKDRVDPAIPPDFSSSPPRPVARPKINGYSSYDRFKSSSSSQSYSGSAPTSRPSSINGIRPTPGMAIRKMSMDVSFGDMPALVRTPEGMAAFRSLDIELDGLGEPGPSTLAHANGQLNHGLVERLRSYVVTPEWESESEDERSSVGVKLECDVGMKRRLVNGIRNRPRKRVRLTPPDSDNEIGARERNRNAIDLWWSAAQSDALLANGLPSLVQFPPSSHPPIRVKTGSNPSKSAKRKRLKKKVPAPPAPSNTLLGIMNSNIRTLKRVRRTHTKFAALNLNAEEGGGGGPGPDELPETAEDVPVDEFVDERSWKTLVGFKSGDLEGGVELGGERAANCLRWTNRKVLEHSGFQGASASSLDVLTGVTSEFLLNVGRTLRFLCDKHGKTMTPEEIVLHTLFECGITKIQDLERYIKDDVVRHGSRLSDLEKKLVNAYREATTVDVLDDDALFGEDEESETPFAMGLGGFSEAFDEDFFGLKELGIAAELGLSSLSIPKRLLKGKRDAGGTAQAKPTEPPPPYPPPPPFVPVTTKNVEDQIGLLRPYYQERIAALAVPVPGPLPPPLLGMPLIPPPAGVMGSANVFSHATPVPALSTLPDDTPTPSQTKLGPIGQVMKSGPSTGTVKKKAKATGPPAKDVGGGGGPVLPLPPGLLAFKPEEMEGLAGPSFGGEVMSVGDAGAGAGAGRRGGKGGNAGGKRKAVDLPPVIAASA